MDGTASGDGGGVGAVIPAPVRDRLWNDFQDERFDITDPAPADPPPPEPTPEPLAYAADPFWPTQTVRGRLEAEGWRAAMRGFGPDANPYTVCGSRARIAWLDGYLRHYEQVRRCGARPVNMTTANEDKARADRTEVLRQLLAAQRETATTGGVS